MNMRRSSDRTADPAMPVSLPAHKRVWYSLWRWAAGALPAKARDDYLPGYWTLHSFCWGFLAVPPDNRQDMVQQFLQGDTPYSRALRRAGGAEAAFMLVLGPSLGKADLQAYLQNNFSSEENQDPGIIDVANVLRQVANVTLGIRNL